MGHIRKNFVPKGKPSRDYDPDISAEEIERRFAIAKEWVRRTNRFTVQGGERPTWDVWANAPDPARR